MVDNKKAFSYVELLFGMLIVVAIFCASVPFITRKTSTGTPVSGTYVCYAIYNTNRINASTAPWRDYQLYETIRRGDGNFATPNAVDECVFYKQKNVRSYSITLIGGGGGGNVANNNSGTLVTGLPGNNGERVTIQSTLAGVWDENGLLTISKCRNSELFNIRIPYEEEFKHCVGEGGELPWASGSGGIERSETAIYYRLLGAYHDMVYEARSNIGDGDALYAGRGHIDGLGASVANIAATHETLLNAQYAPDHAINNAFEQYFRAKLSERVDNHARELLRESANILRTNLNRLVYNDRTTNDSEGANGGYSRFVIYDNTSASCPNGNCIARGGAGARSHGVYTAPTCACIDEACTTWSCARTNRINDDIIWVENATTRDNPNFWQNFFGRGGVAGASIITPAGSKSWSTTAPVANGGAIIISW